MCAPLKNFWLRGLLSRFKYKVTYTKHKWEHARVIVVHTRISGEDVIKKRWLIDLLSRFAYKVTHTKIGGEQTVIKTLAED